MSVPQNVPYMAPKISQAQERIKIQAESRSVPELLGPHVLNGLVGVVAVKIIEVVFVANGSNF